jgi:hypothetical protein
MIRLEPRKYTEGSVVEANYYGFGYGFNGTITRCWDDGSYDVLYDNFEDPVVVCSVVGANESRVTKTAIRLISAPAAKRDAAEYHADGWGKPVLEEVCLITCECWLGCFYSHVETCYCRSRPSLRP